MGEPIISPWIFYIAGVLHCFNFIVVFSMFVSLIFSLVCIITINDCTSTQEQIDGCKIGLKMGLCTALITLMLFVFVPSSTTYYQMVVANYVTYERVEVVKEGLQDIFDKIIETAQELQQRR